MAGISAKLTIRFPTPEERYDPANEAAFRQDLERLLDRLGGELSGGQRILTNVDLDVTPSVALAQVFKLTNGGATTITDFIGAAVGQRVLFIFTDGNTTIADGANLQLNGGVNFVGTANDTLELIWDGTNWYEISRSVN